MNKVDFFVSIALKCNAPGSAFSYRQRSTLNPVTPRLLGCVQFFVSGGDEGGLVLAVAGHGGGHAYAEGDHLADSGGDVRDLLFHDGVQQGLGLADGGVEFAF